MDTLETPVNGYAKYRGLVKIFLWIVIFIIGLLAFLFYPAYTNRDPSDNVPSEFTGDRP